ncbi:MAG: hypothetical protein NVS3B1_06410 [Marmoricola sp.]
MKAPRVYRLESDLVKAIMNMIRDLPEPSSVFKVHGGKFQEVGQPDLIACIRGRFVGIEVKLPGGEPTGVQMGCLRRWEKAGALAGWATSLADVDDLLSHLDDYAWRNPQLERDKDALVVNL